MSSARLRCAQLKSKKKWKLIKIAMLTVIWSARLEKKSCAASAKNSRRFFSFLNLFALLPCSVFFFGGLLPLEWFCLYFWGLGPFRADSRVFALWIVFLWSFFDFCVSSFGFFWAGGWFELVFLFFFLVAHLLLALASLACLASLTAATGAMSSCLKKKSVCFFRTFFSLFAFVFDLFVWLFDRLIG